MTGLDEQVRSAITGEILSHTRVKNNINISGRGNRRSAR